MSGFKTFFASPNAFERREPESPLPESPLPDELNRRRVRLLAQKPALEKAAVDLQEFVNLYGGMQKSTRFGPALALLLAQLEEAMNLLGEIGALDAQRGSTHDRIAPVVDGCDYST